MYDLFGRLESKKKRVIAQRQTEILKLLLREDSAPLEAVVQQTGQHYRTLKNPGHAVSRDVAQLVLFGAVAVRRGPDRKPWIDLRLEWPTEITQTDFFERVQRFPKAKVSPLLRRPAGG